MDLFGRETRGLLAIYLRPQWPLVAVLSLLLLVNSGLQLLSPQIVARYIDTARHGGALATLTLAAVLYLGVALLGQVVAVAETYAAENLAWRATNRLRADLARHCLALDLSFHGAHTPGEMIERIDGDVTQLANFLSRFAVAIAGNALLLLGILALLFRVGWVVGVAFTGFAVVVLVALQSLRGLSVPAWTQARQVSADLYGFLEERLSGLADIRANGAADAMVHRLLETLGRHLRATRRAVVLGLLTAAAFYTFWGIGNGLTFGLGAPLLRSGALTVGTLYLLYAYSLLLLQPLQQIMEHLPDLQTASGSLVRIRELLGTESTVHDGALDGLPDGALAVEVEGVTFAYGGGEAALHALSFRLQPGEVLGVLGRTGSGKTTLTRLLARFYDPTAGTVRLGGVDLRQVRLQGVRRRVGVVTQEVQLFAATVRDNLTFFDPTVADTRLEEVLDALGLRAWLGRLPSGLDTPLAAGGGGLSAGEAQLLALARVFLRDPGLLLLDETSARLDPPTAALLERVLDRLLEGRTAVVVAHRLETVARADWIIILDGGRVVEYGPRALLAGDPGSRFSGLLRQGAAAALL